MTIINYLTQNKFLDQEKTHKPNYKLNTNLNNPN